MKSSKKLILCLLFLYAVRVSVQATFNGSSSVNASLAFIDTTVETRSKVNITEVNNETNQTANPTQEEIKQLEQMFPEDKQDGLPSGCYIRELPIPGTKRMVPLKTINYDLEIVNSLVHITLEQQYENPSRRFLNIYYSFPIRPDSALYKFVAEYNNIIVEGVVKEKVQARKQFDQAKSEGRVVAIGELDTNSKDIINLEIGNIPPKTTVKITISFVQEMALAQNTFYSIQVPSTISPRFMNTIPSQGKKQVRMNSPVADSELPPLPAFLPSRLVTTNAGYTWDFKITLKTTRKPIFTNSLSHKIVKESQSEDGLESVFRLDRETIPNKDFVFVYTPEDFDIPNYVAGYNGNTTTVLVSFIPKFSEIKPEDAYDNLKENKSVQFDLDSVRGQYIFILDRSGSMEGDRIQRAKQSLIVFLKSLPSDSYFNIISFGSNFVSMYPQSIRNEDKAIKDSISQVNKMEADFGGTEIYYPLESALNQKGIDGYPKTIFLLTDGTVDNTEGVIEMARQKSKNTRISSIGIGNGASTRLIEGTAEAGRGKYVMISDSERPTEKIISLLQSSLTPLITKLTLNYDNQGIQSVIPNPNRLPYIIKDSIVNFYLTYEGKLTEPKKISFEYEDSYSKKTYRSEIEVKLQKEEYPFVDKMAHFKVLRALQNIAKDTKAMPEEELVYLPVKDFSKQATDYSIKYQILSEYTSFLAVGKELVDKDKKLFKQLGTQVIEVRQTKPKEYIEQLFSPQSLFTTASSFNFPSFAQALPASTLIPVIQAQPAVAYLALPQPAVAYLVLPQPAVPQLALPQLALPQPAVVQSEIVQPAAEQLVAIPQQAVTSGYQNYDTTSISSRGAAGPVQTLMGQPFDLPVSQPTLVVISPPAPPAGPTPPAPPADPTPSQNKQAQINTDQQSAVQNTNKISIQQVVDLQASNGSWNDQSLLIKLAKNPDVVANLSRQIMKEAVITKLVLLWLEKQSVGKQYSLIIKKAQSWLAKVIRQKNIKESLFNVIQVV